MDPFFLAPVHGGEPRWDDMSRDEKKHSLYRKQRNMLSALLERGAISQTQYDLGQRALQACGGKEHG